MSAPVSNGVLRTKLSDMKIGDYIKWVAPITSELWSNMLSPLGTKGTGINYNFFKVNPSILDPIFAVNADSYWETSGCRDFWWRTNLAA